MSLNNKLETLEKFVGDWGVKHLPFTLKEHFALAQAVLDWHDSQIPKEMGGDSITKEAVIAIIEEFYGKPAPKDEWTSLAIDLQSLIQIITFAGKKIIDQQLSKTEEGKDGKA